MDKCDHANPIFKSNGERVCDDCGLVLEGPAFVFNDHYHPFYSPSFGEAKKPPHKGINYDRKTYQAKVLRDTFQVQPLFDYQYDVLRLRAFFLENETEDSLKKTLSTWRLRTTAEALGIGHLLHIGGRNATLKALRTLIMCSDWDKLPSPALQRRVLKRIQTCTRHMGDIPNVKRSFLNLNFVMERFFREADPKNFPFYQSVFKSYRSKSSLKATEEKYKVLATREGLPVD